MRTHHHEFLRLGRGKGLFPSYVQRNFFLGNLQIQGNELIFSINMKD